MYHKQQAAALKGGGFCIAEVFRYSPYEAFPPPFPSALRYSKE